MFPSHSRPFSDIGRVRLKLPRHMWTFPKGSRCSHTDSSYGQPRSHAYLSILALYSFRQYRLPTLSLHLPSSFKSILSYMIFDFVSFFRYLNKTVQQCLMTIFIVSNSSYNVLCKHSRLAY